MDDIAAELSLQGLLDAVAARTTAPGGGVVAGVVAALAGALCGMCARFSAGDPDNPVPRADVPRADVQRADELRAQAALLAQSDPAVYADYVRARRSGRDDDIAAALDEAIRIPLEMSEVAAELAVIALRLARSGNPNLRGDATVAVLMGVAAARAGAALVCENLAGTGSGTGAGTGRDSDSGTDSRLARAAAIVASVGAVEREVLRLYPALAGP